MFDQMSLYQETNSRRTTLTQDGMWNFRFDPESIGEEQKWMNHLDSSISIPVPASFADFQTTEGIFRVNGNKKGVFNRERQPKDAAFVLKKRWADK